MKHTLGLIMLFCPLLIPFIGISLTDGVKSAILYYLIIFVFVLWLIFSTSLLLD